MNIRILVLLLVPIVIFTSVVSYYVYQHNTIENIIQVPLSVRVEETFGLNADPGVLNFGKLLPGSAGQRAITIENNGTYPVTIRITNSDEIGGWVSVSHNNFEIPPLESQEVNFTVHVPEVDFGYYNGTSTILFKKPFFS